jgi:flagellar biosynthetic protein FliR
MFVFIAVGGFQRVFLAGVIKSFESVRAVDFLLQKDHLFTLFSGALGDLFQYAMVISFPILGTLFLISLSMGLLAKAAPQMNLLMMGFPIAIIVAFLMLFLSIPFIMETFGKIIDSSFEQMLRVLGLAEEAAGG